MQELVVFIASPGDLTEEREAVRQAVVTVNSLFAAKSAIRLRVTGWEETQPSFGRPQSSINPLVEQCDVFIGLLYRRWGTPTGEYSSGFEEEYEQAVGRGGGDEKPHIGIFFKRVPEDQIEDAGPSLMKVLAFRRKLEEQHIALYRQFSSTSDFLLQITHYLVSVIVGQWNPSGDSSPDGTVAKPDTAIISATISEPQIDDEARRQIAATMRGFYNLAEGGKVSDGEELDRDRLLLFSMAAQPEMISIPIHSLNRIYAKGHQYALSVMEHRLLLWTIAADVRSEKDGTLRSVAPGFRMVAPHASAMELADDLVSQILSVDSTHSVATGALHILRDMKARPAELWTTDEFGIANAVPTGSTVSVIGEAPVDKWVHILETAQTESAALEYISAVITESDVELFDVVQERLDDISVALKLRSLTEYVRGDLSGLAEVAATRYVSEGSFFERLLLSSIPSMTTEQLEAVVTGRALPDQVIHDALDVISQRRAPSSEEFGKVLKSGSNRLIAFSFEVAERTEATRNLLAAVAEIKDEKVLKDFKTRLKALAASEEELSAELSGPSSFVSAWSALSWRRGVAMADEARQILDFDCADFLDIEKLKELGYTEDLIEFLRSMLRAAAVELLARIPVSDADDRDVDRFRSELARNDWMSSDPAAYALVRMGAPQDADALLEKAAKSYGEEKREVLRGAAWVGGLDIARKMVVDKDGEIALIGAQEISSRPSVSLDELQQLLYSSHEEVRMEVWKTLKARMERSELEDLLERYPKRDEGYYYDVVAALDRALYLPR
ncbi:DUF4062 domain-containing protein [Streptomyces sp. ME109]|uniref:DUF4062 domain-containing protein n=1 Tax=Streptomyces sp. me109 TaxID=1827853 RepID=UPI00165126BA|nr:DUF4062 domain-containing protein [Streptomyces sp. me109]